MKFVVHEIRSLQELESLRTEWFRLWSHCSAATPFQSPDWLLPCCRHLAPGQLRVLALRSGGSLVGLAPLCQTVDAEGVRTILFLGAGISDYLDVLLDESHKGEAIAAFFAHLAKGKDTWDLCDFQQLAFHSPLLGAELPASLRQETVVQETCPVLMLPAGKPALSACVPAKQYRRFSQYFRRLARIGKLRLTAADASNVDTTFETLLRLHAARWQVYDMPGVLTEPSVQNFHHEVMLRILPRRMLRLLTLNVDEQPVAVFYGFFHRRRTYYYLGGFDPEWKQFSPGVIILGQAIETAIQDGAKQFDFLRGNEKYKYEWGAKDRLNYRRVIWPAVAGVR